MLTTLSQSEIAELQAICFADSKASDLVIVKLYCSENYGLKLLKIKKIGNLISSSKHKHKILFISFNGK